MKRILLILLFCLSLITNGCYSKNVYSTNEKAEQLVEKFIGIFEEMLTDKGVFYLNQSIVVDIKSNEDGKILYKEKRDKNDNEIWWNHPVLLELKL